MARICLRMEDIIFKNSENVIEMNRIPKRYCRKCLNSAALLHGIDAPDVLERFLWKKIGFYVNI